MIVLLLPAQTPEQRASMSTMLPLGQCHEGRVSEDLQDRLFGKDVGAIQTSAEAICRDEGWEKAPTRFPPKA